MRPGKMRGKLLDAPLAVTMAGDMLASVTHLDGADDPVVVLTRLLAEGHQVFVGIVVPGALRREVLRDVDDAGADLVGRLGGRLRRQSR